MSGTASHLSQVSSIRTRSMRMLCSAFTSIRSSSISVRCSSSSMRALLALSVVALSRASF